MMIQVMICVVFVVVLLDKDGEKMCVRVIYIVRKPEGNSKNMQPRLSLSVSAVFGPSTGQVVPLMIFILCQN